MNMKTVCLLLAVIVSTALQGWADPIGTYAQTSVDLPDGTSVSGSPSCVFCTTPVSANSAASNLSGSATANASASFGTVDAMATASAELGRTDADAIAVFTDSLTVHGGGTGSFMIAFVSTGVNATASGNADSEVGLDMYVGVGSLAFPLHALYDVRSDGFTSGLPIDVFTIDASGGDTIYFEADLDVTASAFATGATASATDPLSVLITAPPGFTYSTGSGTSYASSGSSVPEPGSLLLLGTGLIGVVGVCRRRSTIKHS